MSNLQNFLTDLFDDSLLEMDDESVIYDTDMIDDNDTPTSDDFTGFTIRGRYILDGADNLLEAAELARDYANFLEGLAAEGFELRSTIDDDFGYAELSK